MVVLFLCAGLRTSPFPPFALPFVVDASFVVFMDLRACFVVFMVFLVAMIMTFAAFIVFLETID